MKQQSATLATYETKALTLQKAMNQKETIEAILSADISIDDWDQAILAQITDSYARGYLTRYTEELAKSYSSDEEDFRDNFLAAADYDIWSETTL